MSIWDLLFPKRCVNCGKLGGYFCSSCVRTLPVITTRETICPMCFHHAIDGMVHPSCRTRFGIDGLTSAFCYKGLAKKAIKIVKYRGVYDLAHEFFIHVPESVRSLLPKADVLVPVPLHQSRLFLRGFNQAEVFARALSLKLNIPVRTDILRRTKRTISQASLSGRKARKVNLSGAFASSDDAKGCRVIVVDDVFTTGATVREAVQSLKRKGAAMVWFLLLPDNIL